MKKYYNDFPNLVLYQIYSYCNEKIDIDLDKEKIIEIINNLNKSINTLEFILKEFY